MFSLEKVQRNFIHVYKFLMGEVKKMELDISHWCAVPGQETISTSRNRGIFLLSD